MFINKIGYDHTQMNINNQDYGFDMNDFSTQGVTLDMKCVVDGCSEGLHSEVGAKIFCELFKTGNYTIHKIFVKMLFLLGCTPEVIKNFMCFTALSVADVEDEFLVRYCGDGYIIKQRHDDTIEFEKLDDGEYPKYYAYNFLDQKYLTHYKDGVEFERKVFPKSEYKAIGVATDGLRFIFGKEYEQEFIDLLAQRKAGAIKRLINREHKHFKDDITIAF